VRADERRGRQDGADGKVRRQISRQNFLQALLEIVFGFERAIEIDRNGTEAALVERHVRPVHREELVALPADDLLVGPAQHPLGQYLKDPTQARGSFARRQQPFAQPLPDQPAGLPMLVAIGAGARMSSGSILRGLRFARAAALSARLDADFSMNTALNASSRSSVRRRAQCTFAPGPNGMSQGFSETAVFSGNCKRESLGEGSAPKPQAPTLANQVTHKPLYMLAFQTQVLPCKML
jgi:hypothetical protein